MGYLNHRFLAMVSIGYRLWSIWAAVVQGVGLCGRCGLWLPAWGDLVKGCALSTFMGISNCRERPCVAQALRSTVNWLLVRRNAVGAASQNHRELNHGKTGTGLAPRLRTSVNQITGKPEKRDPLWGRSTGWPVWPNHGGFEAISW